MICKLAAAGTLGLCLLMFGCPAYYLHAQVVRPLPSPTPTLAVEQVWLVQAMWLGIDKVPYDGDTSPPRETYPDANSAKRAAQAWCDKLTAWKGVAKLSIKEPFSAPTAGSYSPYPNLCAIDNLTYVAVYGFRK